MSFKIEINCILLHVICQFFTYVSFVAVVKRIFELVGVEFEDDFSHLRFIVVVR